MYGGTDSYQPSYYRPYRSDSEDESDTDSTTSTTSTNEFDYTSPMALIKAAGIPLSNARLQLDYGVNYVDKYLPYAEYIPPPPNSNSFYGETKFASGTNRLESIILLNSRDRDRLVYPQPTNLVLRLPRVYRNIVNLQFSQLKLLSAFYYFRPNKENITLFIQEQDRTNNNRQIGEPNGFPITIDPGSYDINSLLAELNQKMNLYPIFYDFPNGISDFAKRFSATGDLATNFNEVGDYFYDILNNTYVTPPNLTKTYVTKTFFQNRYTNQTNYTYNEIIVAYYYPALKYALLENVNDPNIILTVSSESQAQLLQSETVLSRILYSFQGLNDVVVHEVIDKNITYLTKFRDINTFKYHLVNKYIIAYDKVTNLVTFTSPNLNTSLLNLLNAQYSNYFFNELNKRSITLETYNLYLAQIQQFNAVLLDMYDRIQENLAITYAVNYNTYALSYLSTEENQIFVRDGTNAKNISKNFNLSLLQNSAPPLTSYSLQKDPPKNYWSSLNSELSNTSSTLTSNSIFNNFFNIYNNKFLNQPFINPKTSNINLDLRSHQANVFIPIAAEKYTVIKFSSPVRQTLQIETLSRPLIYRYPAYNKGNIPPKIASIFNYSYEYIDNSNFDLPIDPDVSARGTTWNTLIQNIPITSYSDLITPGINGTAQTCDTFTYLSELFYSVTAPPVSNAPINSVNKYNLFAKFTVTNGPVSFFLYHDRAALMADIADTFNEKPIHYKQTVTIPAGSSNITISWTAYENNRYYFLIRPLTNVFSKFIVTPNIFIKNYTYISLSSNINGFDPTVVPTGPNYGLNFNYAKVYDPDYIRLPISSTLWAKEPTDYPNNILTSNFSPPIGYDSNGYSTDLTDYRPFNKFTQTVVYSSKNNFDPVSENAALFTVNSTYDSSNQSYFYEGSLNQISIAPNYIKYTPGTVAYRQFKIVSWYDQVYIGPTIGTTLCNITYSNSPYSLRTTCNTQIGGYNYLSNSISRRNELSLFDGVCGFTFLPEDGIWNVKSLAFNTNVMSRQSNINWQIQYIGIFNTGDIYNINLTEIKLSNALTILSNVRTYYYLPNQQNNTSANWQTEYSQNSNQYIFDSPYVQNGSYYYFETVVGGTNSEIIGYTQNPRVFLNQPNYMYSAIAFNQNKEVIKITGLTGSPVPFPTNGYSYPIVSNYYFDGVTGSINDRQVIVPSIPTCNLPYGIDFSQSSYEQSMKQTTCALHIANSNYQIQDEAEFKYWSGVCSEIHPPVNISANIKSTDGAYGYFVVQDTTFKIFQFGPTGYTPIQTGQLTMDQIFPVRENTYFTTFTTNETSILFIGLQPSGATSNQIIIKEYVNSTGVLKSYYLNGLISVDENIIQYRQAKYYPGQSTVNYIAFTSYNTVSSQYNIYVAPDFNTSQIQLNISLASPSYPTIQLDKRQRPSIEMTDSPNSLYISFIDSNTQNKFLYNFDLFTFLGNSTYNTDNTEIVYINSLGSNIDNLVYVPLRNNVYCSYINQGFQYYSLITNGVLSNYPTDTAYNLYTSQLIVGKQTFSTPIQTMVSGYFSSRWIINGDYPYIWANRYPGDATVNTAWQIFYPSVKIVFDKIANAPIPIVDKINIEPPEYYHTNMFIYTNEASLSNDIASGWGKESPCNYYVCDTQFNGFQFNSYIENVPLEADCNYYVAIRGYTPSEQFETLVRFYLPNRYDFRWLTLTDISGEILTVMDYMSNNNGLTPPDFNPQYAYSLVNFNRPFVGPHIYGENIVPGFFGISSNVVHRHSNVVGWIGFGDVLDVFLTYYQNYSALNAIISSINAAVLSNLNKFIATELINILPPSALSRQKYTDPLLYSLLFSSGNNYAFADLEEEWGIGWNLGFPKLDTGFLTRHTGNSFFKILDDYVFIKLNDEFHMNRIDTSGKENLAATREPTGMVSQYNTKLLLTTFGGYAQTAINNPIQFNPPLGKLDRISFQLMDTAGNIINNADCEWNASLQITEQMDGPTADSTAIKYNMKT